MEHSGVVVPANSPFFHLVTHYAQTNAPHVSAVDLGLAAGQGSSAKHDRRPSPIGLPVDPDISVST